MIPKIPIMKIVGIFSYFARFFGILRLIFDFFVYILHFNYNYGDFMLKKNILMMTLLSGFLVTANAQEPAKPSPVAVAKTAFGATLPAANPLPANTQVAPAVNTPVTATPTVNNQPAPTAKVAAQPVANPPATMPEANQPNFKQSGPHSAPMTGNLNMGNNVAIPVGEVVNAEEAQATIQTNAIDEKTRLDNEAIRNVFTNFASAINSQNNSKLMSVAREQLIVIGSNQELVSGKKTVEDYFPRIIGGQNYRFERAGFTIEPGAIVEIANSGDIAKVYGRGTEKYKLDSVEHTVSTRWSATVVKEGEEWKVASFHSGVNFSDNSVLKAFEEFGWKIGVAAGLISLLVGFILGLVVMGIVKSKK